MVCLHGERTYVRGVLYTRKRVQPLRSRESSMSGPECKHCCEPQHCVLWWWPSQQGDASSDRVILTRYFLFYHTSHNAQTQNYKNAKTLKSKNAKLQKNMTMKQVGEPRRHNAIKQAGRWFFWPSYLNSLLLLILPHTSHLPLLTKKGPTI